LPGLPSAQSVGLAFARSQGIEGSGPEALAALRALPATRIVGDLNLATLFSGKAPLFTGPIEDGATIVGTNEEMFAAADQAHVPVMVGATGADIGFLPAATKEAAFAVFGPDAAEARRTYDPDGTIEAFPLSMKIGG